MVNRLAAAKDATAEHEAVLGEQRGGMVVDEEVHAEKGVDEVGEEQVRSSCRHSPVPGPCSQEAKRVAGTTRVYRNAKWGVYAFCPRLIPPAPAAANSALAAPYPDPCVRPSPSASFPSPIVALVTHIADPSAFSSISSSSSSSLPRRLARCPVCAPASIAIVCPAAKIGPYACATSLISSLPYVGGSHAPRAGAETLSEERRKTVCSEQTETRPRARDRSCTSRRRSCERSLAPPWTPHLPDSHDGWRTTDPITTMHQHSPSCA